MKKIHMNVYDPKNSLFKTDRNAHAEIQTIECDSTEKCECYKTGCCIAASFFSSCPYGKYYRETGPSKQARSMSGWVNKKEEEKKINNIPYLNSPSGKMAIVNDYVWLNYSYMNDYKNENCPFLKHSNLFISGMPFIKLSDFTVDVVYEIVTFRPQALFGGEITSYAREEVPLFLTNLKEKFPQLYNDFITKYPQYKNCNVSPIGRKALANTLVKGCKLQKNDRETWVWDGEYFVSSNARPFFPIIDNYTERHIKIKPSKNSVVTITALSQVDENTVFVS